MGKGGGNKGQLAMFMRNSEWNEYRYQIIAIGVLLIGAFASVVFQGSAGGLQHVFEDDATMLNKVFSSGEPWVVLCHESEGPIDESYGEAAQHYHATYEDEGFNFAVMNCALKQVTTGTSVYRRYKQVKKERNKEIEAMTIFVVANGAAPRQIHATHGGFTSRSLVAKVRAAAKKRSEPLTNTGALEKKCLRKPTCVVIVTYNEVTKAQKRALRAVMDAHRAVPFLVVDGAKRGLGVPELAAVETWEEGTKDEHLALVFQKGEDGVNSAAVAPTPFDLSLSDEVPMLEQALNKAAAGTLKATPLLSKPTLKLRSA
jgi:hypothetical protein